MDQTNLDGLRCVAKSQQKHSGLFRLVQRGNELPKPFALILEHDSGICTRTTMVKDDLEMIVKEERVEETNEPVEIAPGERAFQSFAILGTIVKRELPIVELIAIGAQSRRASICNQSSHPST